MNEQAEGREQWPDEEWRPVEGWPYEVSNIGRVRRSEPGRGTWPGRILAQNDRQGAGTGSTGPHGSRYQAVCMSRDGEQRTMVVHQLVAEAFLGPAPDGHEVDHINLDREDNRVANLRYVSWKKNRGAKLSDAEVREIRERYRDESVSQYQLADEYRVTRGCIRDLVNEYRRPDV